VDPFEQLWRNANTDADADPYAYSNTDANPDTNAYANADADADPNSRLRLVG
jgi:hypothetical protein